MIGLLFVGLTRLLVGGHAQWQGTTPTGRQRIYFANHSSHLDTLLIWSALPPDLRARTQPVAGADYWDRSAMRRFIARRGLNVVLVERTGQGDGDPLAPLRQALRSGNSLVIFPEGTRGAEPLPGRFRSGLYWLAVEFPNAELVPVYLENPARAFPKGALLPVPITCTARFGSPLQRLEAEEKASFLERARLAVCALAAGAIGAAGVGGVGGAAGAAGAAGGAAT